MVLNEQDDESLANDSELMKRMDELRHTALKTPAPKRRKLGLDDHLELLGDYEATTSFTDESLNALSATVEKDHSFLPIVAQAIAQVRADGDELCN